MRSIHKGRLTPAGMYAPGESSEHARAAILAPYLHKCRKYFEVNRFPRWLLYPSLRMSVQWGRPRAPAESRIFACMACRWRVPWWVCETVASMSVVSINIKVIWSHIPEHDMLIMLLGPGTRLALYIIYRRFQTHHDNYYGGYSHFRKLCWGSLSEIMDKTTLFRSRWAPPYIYIGGTL